MTFLSRWASIALAGLPMAGLADDCNCALPQTNIRVFHSLTPADAVTLQIDGVGASNPTLLKMKRDKVYTLSLLVDPGSSFSGFTSLAIEFPHDDMEFSLDSGANWSRGSSASLTASQDGPVITYSPENVAIRLTDPQSDIATEFPEAGSECHLRVSPASVGPDGAGAPQVKAPMGGIEIPLGAAMTPGGVYRSAGRLSKQGVATTLLASPANFEFNAPAEVTTGSPDFVAQTSLLNGSGQITEKHFIAPGGVLRLRGWNGSAAVSFTGANRSLVEVYERAQYDGGTKAFTGSPHSFYRLEFATGNGLADGVMLVQSNRGISRTEILQVSTDGLGSRYEAGGEIKETLTYPPGGSSTVWSMETTVTRNAEIVSKTADTWSLESWGNALTESSVDPDPTLSADELVTYRSYYADGRERSVSRPDGSWSFMEYYGDTVTTYTPWLSSCSLAYSGGVWSLPSSGLVMITEESVFQGTYRVARVKDISDSGPGTMIHESGMTFLDVMAGALTIQTTAREDSTYLETYSLSHGDFAFPAWLSGRSIMTWDKTGKAVLHAYEKGTWDLSGGFAADADGAYIREVATTGYVPSPSHLSVPDDFDDVPSHGSRTVTITGPYGVVRSEDYVCNSGGTYDLALTRDYEYEGTELHRRTAIKIGALYVWKAEYVPAFVTRIWDQSGTMTETEVDAAGKVIRTTVSGTTGAPAITTTTSRVGRVTTTRVDSKITLIQTLDAAGRVRYEEDGTGSVTTSLYTNGGRTVSRADLGGGARIVTNHYDGSPLSLTGTGAIKVYYTYSLDSLTGFVTAKTTLGTSGGPRNSSLTRYWDGTIVSTSSPDPADSGTPVVVTHLYAATSPTILRSSSSASGVPAAVRNDPAGSAAAALDHYLLGGLETDGNGPVISSGSSNDRLEETSKSFVTIGSVRYLETSRKVFHTAGSAAAYTTTTQQALAPVSVSHVTYGSGLRWTTLVGKGSHVFSIYRDEFFAGGAALISTDDLATSVSPDIVITFRHGHQVSKTSFGSSAAETWTYDASGRVIRETTAAGAVTGYEYNEGGQLIRKRDHENNVTTYAYHPIATTSPGRLWTVTDPAGKMTETYYNSRGQVEETKGTGANRVTWEYNTWGEVSEMRTYRSLGSEDLTQWTMDPESGLLKKKTDAAGKEVNYTYHSSGRLNVRTSARSITTTYSYNGFGDGTTTVYGDTTPTVTITPDRLGRAAQVADGSGTRAITYNSEGADMVSYSSSPGGPLASIVLDYTWASDRLTGYTVTDGAAGGFSVSATRVYDSAGRISSVAGSSSTHTYSYVAGTSTVSGVAIASGGSPWLTRSIVRDRMENIRGIRTTSQYGVEISRHGYVTDTTGRRVRATRENGQRWEYGYDARGQVTSAVKNFPDGSPIPGHQFAYGYDSAGNLTSATLGGTGSSTDGTGVIYTADSLNRPSAVATQGGRFVLGEAPAANAVTVNGSNASRAGGLGFFWAQLSGANTSAPLWSLDTVVSNGSTTTGRTWTPKASETPQYDFDGNLIADGRWDYEWDAENRLVKMTTAAAAYAVGVGVPRQRLEFIYDSAGRRVTKSLAVWNGSSYAYSVSYRYLYDGWNLIAEYRAANPSSTSLTQAVIHVWGLDSSGTLQGAGGTGGLLSSLVVSTSTVSTLAYPAYDGNWNISAWVVSDGRVIDRRDYSPFGRLISDYKNESLTVLAQLSFGFSTRFTDYETGLLYYGYRYLDPAAGRWLNRDPIGERGGVNLYGFIGNDGVNHTDTLGLAATWARFQWYTCKATMQISAVVPVVPDFDTKYWSAPGWGLGGTLAEAIEKSTANAAKNVLELMESVNLNGDAREKVDPKTIQSLEVDKLFLECSRCKAEVGPGFSGKFECKPVTVSEKAEKDALKGYEGLVDVLNDDIERTPLPPKHPPMPPPLPGQ